MKKLFATMGLPAVMTVVFLLGGLFFGAVDAQAQTVTGSQPTSPIKAAVTWKTPQEVVPILQQELDFLSQQMANPGYEIKYKYQFMIYEGIIIRIEAGMPVANAAYYSFYEFAPSNEGVNSQSTPGITPAGWQAMYNDMISLLTL